MSELLIDMVKRHEAIYNTKSAEYRDGAARNAAWASVAELCGSTVEECKESWSKLRNCYTNAKKRRMRKNDHKFDPWRYEEEMSFLDPHMKDRPPPENDEVIFVEDKWKRSSSSMAPGASNRMTASLEREHLLIDLIRRYEVIYNTKCSEYRYAKERHAAWVEIADLHGSTVAQCKEAWMKLRNCYTNAIKRQHVKSSKNLPTTPWRFEKEMSFLRPHLNLRFNPVLDNTEALLYEDEDSWEACLSPKGTHSTESEVTPRSAYKRKASPSSIFEVVDVEEKTPELLYDNPDLDDIDHFFLSMSKMTKKLPKIDQLRIKLNLHKAINEAELKHLEDTDESTKKYENSCENGVIKVEVSSPRQLALAECHTRELRYL